MVLEVRRCQARDGLRRGIAGPAAMHMEGGPLRAAAREFGKIPVNVGVARGPLEATATISGGGLRPGVVRGLRKEESKMRRR